MRIPVRMNLSMYAGPIPRPVVPIFVDVCSRMTSSSL